MQWASFYNFIFELDSNPEPLLQEATTQRPKILRWVSIIILDLVRKSFWNDDQLLFDQADVKTLGSWLTFIFSAIETIFQFVEFHGNRSTY